jgi:hypothetical protein
MFDEICALSPENILERLRILALRAGEAFGYGFDDEPRDIAAIEHDAAPAIIWGVGPMLVAGTDVDPPTDQG